jgi:hypothetical protein
MGAGGGAFSSRFLAAPDAPDAPYRFQNIFQQHWKSAPVRQTHHADLTKLSFNNLTFLRRGCSMPEPVLEPGFFLLAPYAPYPFIKKNK